ncbi:alpha-(1,3)-fucosyltransferase C-like [Penaeus monodon]|uniref:alpha-(1,3)-fucosyltransferase C-like n=1 Tax=Penaeus monodon TaxID=6687 RepID=UPI0018A79DE7|nr:alpha-(1,3)-fucosyltransferase C-like [Penaeus monodon]
MVDDQHVNLTRLGGIFNWTMTYRLDSDVVVPYGRVTPKSSDNFTPTSKDYWSSKDPSRLAAWMVSHCGTPGRREWFVKELVRHMKVDVFGRCGHKKCGKNISIKTLGSFDQDKCNAEIGQYMFYFALENAICQDYVSEKFFLALQLDVIPVVFGGGNYAAIAPPTSYINALDFPSPKALADYLKVVASNATLYNKYLEWKDHYNVELGHPFSTMVCDLCAKLHDPRSFELPRITHNFQLILSFCQWERLHAIQYSRPHNSLQDCDEAGSPRTKGKVFKTFPLVLADTLLLHITSPNRIFIFTI